MLRESKQLLNLFITNDQSVEYKYYLNEELDRIKTVLSNSLQNDKDVTSNQEIKEKLEEVHNKIKIVSLSRDITKEHITLILKTQKLIKEMEIE